MNLNPELPIPPHFDPQRVDQVWRVPYQAVAEVAHDWAEEHALKPAMDDQIKIALLGIDIQNTFCIPGYELFVAGRSGRGAVDDNIRLCEFIYKNIGRITHIMVTMDTHQAMQIFHPIFFIDQNGHHPPPFTLISNQDIIQERWRFNPALEESIGKDVDYMQRYLIHYTQQLEQHGRYNLTIWPYHAMLGGIGHALVSAFEEAIFFHTIARNNQSFFDIKGDHPLTEHYSALGPEVITEHDGEQIADRDMRFIKFLQEYDLLIIAGQAKSHCVAWTIQDLLEEIQRTDDQSLNQKIYILEDCTSPVVIPGVIDYTESANKAFARFSEAGVNIVKSTEDMQFWPGMENINANWDA